jgi:hypothetical protein
MSKELKQSKTGFNEILAQYYSEDRLTLQMMETKAILSIASLMGEVDDGDVLGYSAHCIGYARGCLVSGGYSEDMANLIIRQWLVLIDRNDLTSKTYDLFKATRSVK